MGANPITPQLLGLQEVEYLNKEIEAIEKNTGVYPSGSYTICIRPVCANPDCDGSGLDAGSMNDQPFNCINIQIENPTPLLLSYPLNNSEIEEIRPTYTWIPPAPILSTDGLNYNMKLVEVMDGQSKSDALAINRPLIELNGIENPMLMHPADIPDLEVGKTYAWQVQAYVGELYFATSEQWKFKIKEEEKKVRAKQLVILKIDDNDIHTAEDTLSLLYKEQKKSGSLNLIITDPAGKEVDALEFETKYGENILEVDLLDPKFNFGTIYRVQVLEGTKQKYLLKFRIKN